MDAKFKEGHPQLPEEILSSAFIDNTFQGSGKIYCT